MLASKIIVIGGSAGCLDSLRMIVEALPVTLEAAVVVAIHLSPNSPSNLAQILSKRSKLPVVEATDRMELSQGQICVARPNHHVLVEYGHIHLTRGPKENHSRPALNPLFRTAALTYGRNTIGVILSGALDDGAAGLWEIKRRGGLAIAQAPEDAPFPDMPGNAIQQVQVDFIEPATRIGLLLTHLTGERTGSDAMQPGNESIEPMMITCPECRGPMEQVTNGNIKQFRCRVKHCYSPQAMLSAHTETEERTLWSAVVALEEGADLSEQLMDYVAPENRSDVFVQVTRRRLLAGLIRRAMEEEATQPIQNIPHSASETGGLNGS